MSLLEEMAALVRKRDDMELAERQAAEDRAQERVEKKAAKALAARLQPQTDFKMPPFPRPRPNWAGWWRGARCCARSVTTSQKT